MVGAIGLAVVVGSLAGAAEGDTNRPTVSVTATYDGGHGHMLRMRVENRSLRPVIMNEAFLPWGSIYSTLLVAAVPMDPIAGATLIERTIVSENPVGAEIAIPPGGALSGTIDLERQFRAFDSWNRKEDVIVFWSYMGRPTSGVHTERLGGVVVVPKRSVK